MIRLMLGIIAIPAGFVAKRKAKNAGAGYAGALLLISLLGLAVAIWPFFSVVPTGHTGVVTTFGKVEDYTLDSGMHMVAPWKSVVAMDNRVQKQTVELSCFSSDIQEVSMTYTANYQINKSNAMTLYRTVGKSYYDTVIAPSIAESVKVATAKYTAEALIGDRATLAGDIEGILSDKLAQYNIEIVSTSIEDMDFTDAFTNAVEKKQVAQQDKLRAETEKEKAEIEAEAAASVRRTEADAEAYEKKTLADAEAEANQKIAASLTPELVEYSKISKWNGKLPQITGNGSTILNASEFLMDVE